jgi:hypothetical protein
MHEQAYVATLVDASPERVVLEGNLKWLGGDSAESGFMICEPGASMGLDLPQVGLSSFRCP